MYINLLHSVTLCGDYNDIHSVGTVNNDDYLRKIELIIRKY